MDDSEIKKETAKGKEDIDKNMEKYGKLENINIAAKD